MKNTNLKTIRKYSMKGIALILMISLYSLPTVAQQIYNSTATAITIKGTSTLHDWDMKSNVGNTKATFKIENGEITSISELTFTIAVETLKGSKSGLDKNAYKALNVSKHKNITYKMSSGTVTKTGTNYTVKTKGTLTISGNTKPVDITASATLNSDQSISVTGVLNIEMTTFGVTPPTVVLGTIKTGNVITIEYNTKLTK